MNSLQRIFDAAWQEFLVNDRLPSVGPTGVCTYLNPTGRKCAVGLCIPDGHPAQSYQGQFQELLLDFNDLFPDLGLAPNPHYYNDFQGRLHDNLIRLHRDYLSDSYTCRWGFDKLTRMSLYIAVAKDYGLMIPLESEFIVHNIYAENECGVYW